MTAHSKLKSFQVPFAVHLFSGLVDRSVAWWIALSKLETFSLGNKLDSITIDRPIYVSGLARSGTTILLELLSRHPDVATHKYRDFPGQFIPTWWNRGQKQNRTAPQERAHGDRIQVTPDSPEAMEESLWMAFFPSAHQLATNQVLDERTAHEPFERFYRDHIRKLLWVRNGSRYVSKGNYNFTRFAYLQKLFPTARFVAAIRHPRNHIASLIRQQRLFCTGETEYPRALAHMRRVGHFEFGLDRRPICLGDGRAQEVAELWERGEEVRGTARYWASLYGWLADQLDIEPFPTPAPPAIQAGRQSPLSGKGGFPNQDLKGAVLIVRYEDFCQQPQVIAARILAHCGLDSTATVLDFTAQIEAPSYYQPEFSDREESIIRAETGAVAKRFGYTDRW